MGYIPTEIVEQAKKMDLLTYLKNYEPYDLIQFSNNTYSTRSHDSIKISNGKWMWWSQGVGGKNALDYLMKVKGMTFLEAVERIVGNVKIQEPVYEIQEETVSKDLVLPEKCKTNRQVYGYLLSRGIDKEIIDYCIEARMIMESLPYHNIVFIGYDESKKPRYAAYRATNKTKVMGDCLGSKKQYSFCFTNAKSSVVHTFESAIDLLSFATLHKRNKGNWKSLNLVSLAGVHSKIKKLQDSKVPLALEGFLKRNPHIRSIVLHLDSDNTGRYASKALKKILSDSYEVIDDPPPFGKDYNDFLQYKITLSKVKNQMERSHER